MATYLDGPAKLMVDLGVMDVILPFLLIFSIVYGTLIKTRMMEKKQSSIVAFVLAFMFIAITNYVGGLTKAVPLIALAFVVGVCLVLIMSGVGINIAEKTWMGGMVVALILLLTLFFFGFFNCKSCLNFINFH